MSNKFQYLIVWMILLLLETDRTALELKHNVGRSASCLT